jgi:hypothetical protein
VLVGSGTTLTVPAALLLSLDGVLLEPPPVVSEPQAVSAKTSIPTPTPLKILERIMILLLSVERVERL